jgi:hypothetical protein
MRLSLLIISFFLISLPARSQQTARAVRDSVPVKNTVDSADAKHPALPLSDKIIFPNAFMWNHTGPTGGYSTERPDDFLFLPETRNVSEYRLQIFNRSGGLVFESTDCKIGWDGYLRNGDLAQQGVYVWKANGKFLDGTAFKKVGDVTFIH